jgi:hypothetical protein
MDVENITAHEAIGWARNVIFELCEETVSDPALCQLAQIDAFARGRIHEAQAIRDAVDSAIRLLLREAPMPIAPLISVGEPQE